MITKPIIDNKQYKFLELDNKIKTLMVYDPNISKSYISLCINVGFYKDKIDGVAHFIEHLLFLGTKKYPKPNYLFEYIGSKGGTMNAMTAEEYTTYYYKINSEYLEESLDIFSDFFINPLLSKESIAKEMHAIDSEFQKNSVIDAVKNLYILKEGSDVDSVFKKSGCGNMDTLNVSNIGDYINEFYNTYYSSNLMNVVVISNNMDIENLIKNKFSPIKNKNVIIDRQYDLPYKESKIFTVNHDYEYDVLELCWFIPCNNNYKARIMQYIAYLLNSKHKNGIANTLINEKLCRDLQASVDFETSSFVILSVHIILTDVGYSNISSILDYIISNIYAEENTYNDFLKINKIMFDYTTVSNSEYIISLSRNLHKYPIEDVIFGDYHYDPFNAEEIRKYISYINKSATIIINSNKFKHAKRISKWYDMKYDVINTLSASNIKIKESVSIPNILYLPDDFNLTDINKDLVRKTINGVDIISKKSEYDIPKINVNIVFNSENFYKSCYNYLVCMIFCNIFNDVILEDNYIYDVSMSTYAGNLHLQISGFTQYMYDVTKTVINKILKMKLNDIYFDNAKKIIIDNITNFNLNSSKTIAQYELQQQIWCNMYSHRQILETINNIALYDMNNIKKWIMNSSVKLFYFGNILDDTAQYADIFSGINKTKWVYSTLTEPKQLNEGEEHYYYRQISNDNLLTIIAFEFENITINVTKNWDTLLLIIKIIHILIKDRFYNDIRTTKQMGYMVRNHVTTYDHFASSLYVMTFLIQSNMSPMILRNEIKRFIKNAISYINIKDNELNIIKNNIKKELKIKYNNFNKEYDYYLEKVIKDIYIDYNAILYNTIDSITVQNLIDFWKKYFIDDDNKKIRMIELYKK